MSSNINLVDKLNPISFEQNEKLKIKTNFNTLDSIENFKNNKKANDSDSLKDTKITISLPQNEMDLIKLEKLHDRCLNELDDVVKKAQSSTKNDIDDEENSLKKKLFLKYSMKSLHQMRSNQY